MADKLDNIITLVDNSNIPQAIAMANHLLTLDVLPPTTRPIVLQMIHILELAIPQGPERPPPLSTTRDEILELIFWIKFHLRAATFSYANTKSLKRRSK